MKIYCQLISDKKTAQSAKSKRNSQQLRNRMGKSVLFLWSAKRELCLIRSSTPWDVRSLWEYLGGHEFGGMLWVFEIRSETMTRPENARFLVIFFGNVAFSMILFWMRDLRCNCHETSARGLDKTSTRGNFPVHTFRQKKISPESEKVASKKFASYFSLILANSLWPAT